MIKFIANKAGCFQQGFSTVYFEFEGRFFPHKDWTDFDRVIFIWADYLSKSGSRDVLFFMDGPYEFEVERQANRYMFRFYTRYQEGTEMTDEYECSAEEYDSFRGQLAEYVTYLKSIN